MKLSNLATTLRAAGLTVVETEGWASRGYAGQDLKEVRGVLWHHTATNRTRYATADAPTLAMCINGRPDLPGPLCNIVFGRNGTAYLVAAGVANHAGAGSAPGVPKDMGNHYLVGIEMESSGIAPWDWTPDQIRVAPHLGAALEHAYMGHLPAGERLQIGHLEYSSQGKIDPAGWPGGMDGLRATINAALDGSAALAPQGTITPQEDDFMALFANLAEFKQAVADVQQPMEDVTRQFLGDKVDAAALRVLNGQQAMEDVTRDFLKDRIKESSPAEIAVQIDAAGIAKEVQAELIKLIGGAK